MSSFKNGAKEGYNPGRRKSYRGKNPAAQPKHPHFSEFTDDIHGMSEDANNSRFARTSKIRTSHKG